MNEQTFENKKDEFRALVIAGKHRQQIAEELGIHQVTVNKWARRLGLTIQPKSLGGRTPGKSYPRKDKVVMSASQKELSDYYRRVAYGLRWGSCDF